MATGDLVAVLGDPRPPPGSSAAVFRLPCSNRVHGGLGHRGLELLQTGVGTGPALALCPRPGPGARRSLPGLAWQLERVEPAGGAGAGLPESSRFCLLVTACPGAVLSWRRASCCPASCCPASRCSAFRGACFPGALLPGARADGERWSETSVMSSLLLVIGTGEGTELGQAQVDQRLARRALAPPVPGHTRGKPNISRSGACCLGQGRPLCSRGAVHPARNWKLILLVRAALHQAQRHNRGRAAPARPLWGPHVRDVVARVGRTPPRRWPGPGPGAQAGDEHVGRDCPTQSMSFDVPQGPCPGEISRGRGVPAAASCVAWP